MRSETDRDGLAEVWQLIKATDAQIKETSAEVRETSASLRRLEGLFTSQWGKMLEALVEPGALDLFQQRGIDVHRTYRRAESQVGGATMEIDLLLEDESDVVAVEVKSMLRVDDVRAFLDDLAEFLRFFPRYRGMTVYGAVAGLTFAEGTDRFAYRNGLFVLGVTGEGVVRIKNGPGFRPKDFGVSA